MSDAADVSKQISSFHHGHHGLGHSQYQESVCNSIHELFLKQLAKSRDQVAVCEGNRRVSYLSLSLQAGGIQAALTERKILTGDRVVLCLPNGINAVASIFGVLASGGCYVPVNPEDPIARMIAVLEDSGAKFLISNSLEILPDGLKHFCKSKSIEIINFSDLKEKEFVATPETLTRDSLAYIMYTSGSTGQPKGVAISHGNVLSFLENIRSVFPFKPTDRVANHSRIAFDVSVFEIMAPLCCGACVFPVATPVDRLLPEEFIIKNKITVWISVPSVISMLRKSGSLLRIQKEGCLRFAVFCGEAIPMSNGRAWLESLPDVTLYNCYGPTECTVFVTAFPFKRISSEWTTVPIGPTIGNNQIRLIKDEIVIVGPQVAGGYWKLPIPVNSKLGFSISQSGEKIYYTGDIAVEDSEGGWIWRGRRDLQAKVMGYRIELGAIENLALDQPGCADSAALVQNKDELTSVVLFVELEAECSEKIFSKEFIKRAREVLQTPAIPEKIIFIRQLPKTSNGKIDRARLRGFLEK